MVQNSCQYSRSSLGSFRRAAFQHILQLHQSQDRGPKCMKLFRFTTTLWQALPRRGCNRRSGSCQRSSAASVHAPLLLLCCADSRPVLTPISFICRIEGPGGAGQVLKAQRQGDTAACRGVHYASEADGIAVCSGTAAKGGHVHFRLPGTSGA